MKDLYTSLELAIRPYLSYFLSPTGNLIFSLMVFTLLVALYFLARHSFAFQRIYRSRAKVPLVIGGWGTRGKSGTERLKAALFASLDSHVVAKTTGSSAMFIRSLPGRDPLELYIFRPYDKASIWEQEKLLSLAAKSNSQVFLWECMALNQRYVEILQRQWMRDDYTTITNAYPDHEDIQGPSGFDVAQVISHFIPKKGKVLTTEVQMLPLLKEEARRMDSELMVVNERDPLLVPRMMMQRFPYEEHPANVALVLRLAEELGIDREQALVEMTERVVPEIGVLRVFPQAEVSGRWLQFVNGMSANERAGFMNNWRRTGFERIGQEGDLNRWAVALINNRADRISRSQVFARILVEDVFAHRYIVVGSNVRGMRGFINNELKLRYGKWALIDITEFKNDPERERPRAEKRLEMICTAMRLDSDALTAIRMMFEQLPESDRIGKWSEEQWENWCEAQHRKIKGHSLQEVESILLQDKEFRFSVGSASLPFLAETAARHLVMDSIARDLQQLFEEKGASNGAIEQLNRQYRKRLVEQVLRSVVVLRDSAIKGDPLIHFIAGQVPPGYHAKIMGMQNIKGPGLEIVYRWQAYDRVLTQLGRFDTENPDDWQDAIIQLMSFEDYGVMDSHAALMKIESLLDQTSAAWEPLRPALRKLYDRLNGVYSEAAKGLHEHRALSPALWGARQIEMLFDFVASIWRTVQADNITNDLLSGKISQERAATKLRELMQQQKGGWLGSRSRRWHKRR